MKETLITATLLNACNQTLLIKASKQYPLKTKHHPDILVVQMNCLPDYMKFPICSVKGYVSPSGGLLARLQNLNQSSLSSLKNEENRSLLSSSLGTD